MMALIAAGLMLAGPALAHDHEPGGEVVAEGPNTAPAEKTVAPTTQPVIMGGAATPKELLDRLGGGMLKLDIDVVVGSIAPEFQPAVRKLFVGIKRLAARAEAVKKTTADKLGAPTAEKVFKEMNFADSGPLTAVTTDGKIDWERVAISEQGDKATVKIDGQDQQDILLRKIDGKWYLLPGQETADSMNAQAEQAGAAFAAMTKAMDAFEQAVKDGKVTAENAEAEFQKAMMAAMLGAAGGGDDGGACCPHD